MRTLKVIAVVLLVALTASFIQPARAEAMEPTTAIALGSVAVAAVILAAFLVVANTRERQVGEGAMRSTPADDAGGVQAVIRADEAADMRARAVRTAPDAGGVQAVIRADEAADMRALPVMTSPDAGAAQAQ